MMVFCTTVRSAVFPTIEIPTELNQPNGPLKAREAFAGVLDSLAD